jgi:hypothetical protein
VNWNVVIAGVVVLCFLGCGRPSTRNGEIFLVKTDGATDDFGGLVEVCVVGDAAGKLGSSEVLDIKARRLIELEKLLASTIEQTQKVRKQIRAAGDSTASTQQDGRSLVSKADNLVKSAQQLGSLADVLAESLRREAAVKESRDKAIQEFNESWMPIISAAKSSTKTDSDGDFVVTLGKDDGVCAHATRRVGNETQHFIWMLSPTEMAKNGKLLLSNDNTLPACRP